MGLLKGFLHGSTSVTQGVTLEPNGAVPTSSKRLTPCVAADRTGDAGVAEEVITTTTMGDDAAHAPAAWPDNATDPITVIITARNADACMALNGTATTTKPQLKVGESYTLTDIDPTAYAPTFINAVAGSDASIEIHYHKRV